MGKYRLVRLLGKGGFAEVYLGEHVQLKMPAAVKILHTHLSEEGAASFLREAQTIAGLLHPRIVRIFDFDIQEQRPFLVMDYAPHGSLRTRYPHGTKLPPAQGASYIEQIASALQYAHNQHLIHRDIKPENMLLGRNNEVLLSDFGIVTIAYSSSSMRRQSAIGTLLYMAPEQIQGQPQPASDQYALAVTAYSWLCGEFPFNGSMTEIIAQHLAIVPPSLCERVPEVTAEVEKVIWKALAKEPGQRYPSVQEFAMALTAAVQAPAGNVNLLSAEDESMLIRQPVNQLQGQSPPVAPMPQFTPVSKVEQEEDISTKIKSDPISPMPATHTPLRPRRPYVGIFIGLAVIVALVTLLFAVPAYNRQVQANATATAQTSIEAAQTATTIAAPMATATMNSRLATAQVASDVTATAESKAIATVNAEATATFAADNPSPNYFSSRGTLQDYASLEVGGLFGVRETTDQSGDCRFKDGAYHVTMTKSGYYLACDGNIYLSDGGAHWIVEVEMTLVRGDCAVLRMDYDNYVSADPVEGQFLFALCWNGSGYLSHIQNNQHTGLSRVGPGAMRLQPSWNKLGFELHNGILTGYLNTQRVLMANIGVSWAKLVGWTVNLGALVDTTTTEAAYKNIRIWQ